MSTHMHTTLTLTPNQFKPNFGIDSLQFIDEVVMYLKQR